MSVCTQENRGEFFHPSSDPRSASFEATAARLSRSCFPNRRTPHCRTGVIRAEAADVTCVPSVCTCPKGKFNLNNSPAFCVSLTQPPNRHPICNHVRFPNSTSDSLLIICIPLYSSSLFLEGSSIIPALILNASVSRVEPYLALSDFGPANPGRHLHPSLQRTVLRSGSCGYHDKRLDHSYSRIRIPQPCRVPLQSYASPQIHLWEDRIQPLLEQTVTSAYPVPGESPDGYPCS